jgi:dTDP-glucose 4,6-dehydratase
MRVLVTGGAGFIGSHFVRYLVGHLGTSVTVLDALTYAARTENLQGVRDRIAFIHGDIRSWDVVDHAVSQCDMLVHFAAESHVDRSLRDARPFVSTNVLGTQMLVDAAVRHGIQRFVHVSTDEVYGSIREGSWTEDSPLAPRSPYAASKAASDLIVLSAHHTYGLNVVITRGSNTYGPYQYPEKLIPHFTTQLLEKKPVPLYGDGLNVRDWLHVDDHVRAIYMAAEKGGSGEVYHVGGGQELSNIQVTDIILRTLGCGWDAVEFVTDRQGHDHRYSLDTSKTRKTLCVTPEHKAVVGIPDTVRWYRDNRSWWDSTYAGEVTA